MDLSRTDAAQALEQVGAAGLHMRRLSWFRASAPIFIMWGAIWFVANSLGDIDERWVGPAWLLAIPGVIVSAMFGARRRKQAQTQMTPVEHASLPNFTVIGLAGWIGVFAIMWVMWPLAPKQINAVISLTAATAYMLAGGWLGWRLVMIGGVMLAATLLGYFLLKEHYYLWMGVVGGGSLAAGGLWLRTA